MKDSITCISGQHIPNPTAQTLCNFNHTASIFPSSLNMNDYVIEQNTSVDICSNVNTGYNTNVVLNSHEATSDCDVINVVDDFQYELSSDHNDARLNGCSKKCHELLSDIMPEDFNESTMICLCKQIQPYTSFGKKISNCNGLSIAHLNVRSLLPKINQIRLFLYLSKVDMLCINEAWLDSTVTNKDIRVQDYTIYRNDRNRRGGGALIYVREDVKCDERNDLILSPCESVWLEVKTIKSKPILVCSLYRPPDSDAAYMSNVYDMLEKADSEEKSIVLLSDMNFDYNVNENLYRNPVYHIECMYSMSQLISEPTRVTTESSTTIDVILSNIPELHTHTGVFKLTMSDHYMTYTVINQSVEKQKVKHNIVRYRDYKKFDENLFLKDLEDSTVLNNVSECQDMNDAWKQFKNEYLRICDKHAPIKTSRLKNRCNFWMNRDILLLMYERDYIHDKATRLHDPELQKEYRRLRNKVTYLTKKAEQEYYVNLEKESKTDPNALWRALRKLAPSKRDNQPNIDLSADDFNKFFASVGEKTVRDRFTEQKEMPWKGPDSIYKLSFKCVSSETVYKLLSSLSPNSSIDIHNFDCKLMKLSAKVISLHIAFLFNLSISTGVVPDDWKYARVTPIYKGKGDTEYEGNYRPISVICHIAKLIEKEIQVQLLHYLIQHDFICLDQSAYLKFHSTQTSLHNTVDEWLQNIDDQLLTAVCFLDISKCFDTIDHSILLNKLNRYGIRDNECKWFLSYLSDRKQVVYFNNELSAEEDISIGVPQGSTLGPLLFLIYVNDLPQYVNNGRISMYADDTVLYCTGKTVDDVNESMKRCLSSVCDWYEGNRLCLNTGKSNTMLVASSRVNISNRSSCLCIQMQDQDIEQVSSMKYLGVHIDDQLTWDKHISELISRLSSKVAWLRRLSTVLPKTLLCKSYNTYVQPILEYACSVWGNCAQYNLDQVQRLQNRAARAICKNYDFINTRGLDLVLGLGWTPFIYRRKYFIAVQMFKCIHGMAPANLCNDIIMACEAHDKTTRSIYSNDVVIPDARTEFYKRSFKYEGAVVWNNLPDHLKCASSINVFKKYLCSYITDMCINECL